MFEGSMFVQILADLLSPSIALLQVGDRLSEGVVLHLWLKGIRGKEVTHWRGLAFAESVEHLWVRDNLQLSQSPLVR